MEVPFAAKKLHNLLLFAEHPGTTAERISASEHVCTAARELSVRMTEHEYET
jgi:hypothetical protein